ncbi:MAG: sensor histidine kinase KdpD [Clostridium beijerinckii]|uniref:histidine kinase n=1 Tax=Clostridium beijerinckii TaxID=1520 RepID=A0AB74VPR8_CLOBE|nr:sensor histidine kinase KdpD [Clostridium beijerinckii]ALB48756.2 sensor histidine kinase KdpD [Clostridium beijerinckii NRRL B-598]MCI1477432.1 sensor histidine kinase KdpD [Clostridium beijerinckii]MCI1577209.1 sensor histidine kinase KdpD [Clostridium beijerinckii]MCI1582691.1 sensor histidine kinase KdpD [Clostridium beijerinckii]MCI1624007.1 sensor histidine kinase KdpD [Clostridium beijerinckii]
MDINERPDPQYLLNQIKKEENVSSRGKLKIFFGYAAGVGKSYAMLMEAHDMKKLGYDVVIGYIEPHARPETMALLNGLESIENRIIEYKGITLKEFDLDMALIRKPEIMLVDELAHTNASEQRHRKRWQDIEELLEAGINVYTTLNVQHIESLNDIVESITHISVRERIPDKIFDEADKVELIDIEPDELLKRFSDGKVYDKEQATKAFNNFFTKNNLFALREIALRRTADRVNYEVESVRLSKGQITVMPTVDAILACISSSPSSSRVIRTARRMAEAHHSKWIAFYVETTKSRNLSKKDKESLSANFKLAEELDGEIVTVYSDDIVEQIIQYAKFRNVTKIIIGKNHKKPNNFFRIYARDIVDKLMESNSYIDVYVIPNSTFNKEKENIIKRKKVRVSISWKEILTASLIMIISTMISLFIDYIGFREANVIMIFILGVIIVNMKTRGYLLGFICSIISIFLFNFLFTDPRYSLEVYDKSYLATFPIMLIVTFTIGTLTSKIQREAQNSLARENTTQILYRVSRKLLSATGTADVVGIGIKYLSRLLERTVICYLVQENKLTTPFIYTATKGEKDRTLLNKEEEAVAYWTLLNDKESGAGTNTFYGAKGYYMPLKSHNKVLGVLGVSCITGNLKPEQKFIFETVASQIYIALDREILAETQKNSKLEIESERLRSNLLRSISHDLRSPLAGIKGAISTIIETGELLSKDTKDELFQGIYDDTEWLIRLVENLLSMTRFEGGNMKIKKNLELVEEVVYEAVQRTSKRLKDHEIKVTVPEDVIMLSMDGNLIEQVLINLFDNAIKFTPKEALIEVKVYEEVGDVIFEVIDDGIGISEEILPHIFDRFFTNGDKISDSRRGVGLGLAICKSIVEGHGGKISAQNKDEGGAIFRFNIPKEGKIDG